MSRSIDLLLNLTSTDLTIIKDGLTVETDRLRKIATGYSQDKTSDQFKNAMVALYTKVDLENTIAEIIEAKIAEDHENHKTPF